MLFLLAVAPLAGCGSAVFYDTVRTGCEVPPREAPAPAAPAAPPPTQERATEIVRDDGWRDSLRELIQEPPQRLASSDPACIEDLRELKVQVSNAIDLAIAHQDWTRERCLSVTGQTVGTLYHASLGVPFVDQKGRILPLNAECSAVQMARVAQACAS
jgi:hypothetical protein